jgi:hypothetical protein
VFDFQLFEVLEKLIRTQKSEKNTKIAVVLLNAKLKFEQLTENDEYLFDETKDIKEEIYAIRDFLNSREKDFWQTQTELFQKELDSHSDFVFFALELVEELKLDSAFDKLNNLLKSSNQTLVLKTVEVIKELGNLTKIDKNIALAKITDSNIKAILESIFLHID